ncbi:hypothetical protein NliqN6_0940 [Naganishia liquefaciens]|uniref:Peptide hydrolase n=1 Tax=Naganishia liquefaciens TaxID=104408 RepID=A0A8H3TP06_9TREE|nr:hypothetical protein NliqN6_0940 [Naganishia liquefaciens]
MLPTSCLIAVLAALVTSSSAVIIPRPAQVQEHYVPSTLQLGETDQTALASSVLAINDVLSVSALKEMDEHLKDYKGWNLEEKRLIAMEGEMGEEFKWVTEMDKVALRAKGTRFMDITDTPHLGMGNMLSPSGSSNKLYSYPSPSVNSTTHAYAISHLFPKLSTDTMKTNLMQFSGFRTRYYRSDTGKQSQAWLLAKVQEYAAANPSITVKEHPHPWGQNSIVARIPIKAHGANKGKDDKKHKKKEESVVIIGAHQDSANMWPFLPAPGGMSRSRGQVHSCDNPSHVHCLLLPRVPGLFMSVTADDDGSGTTSILDAFRVLASSPTYAPTASAVEFHWYSAEEGGLLGSQAVAKVYEEEGVDVKGMIQMDMTAWVKKDTEEVVGVITDYVDPALSKFIADAVTAYCDIPPVPTKCGYACSDHASWSKAGYQSAFSIESTFENSNHAIHSTGDTIEHPEFSFDHMQEFSKLAIAFAVELGGVEVPKK